MLHGGAHGGWCWERVVPLFDARATCVTVARDRLGVEPVEFPGGHSQFYSGPEQPTDLLVDLAHLPAEQEDRQ